MPPEDRLMLNFTRRWIPYGGPRASDIYVEFGMTTERFFDRLASVIGKVEPTVFSARELAYFETTCPRHDRVGRG